MPDEKTFEMIDLTDQDQIEYDPPIEAIPEEEPEEEEYAVVEEVIEDSGEEEPAAPIEDAEGNAPDAEPELSVEDSINNRINQLNERIDTMLSRLDEIMATVGNINSLEIERSRGPQGFFKAVEDGSSPERGADLPKIVRNYI